MKPYPALFFEQPAGRFLLTTMPAKDIIRICKTLSRTKSSLGVQRPINEQRTKKIADFIDNEPTRVVFPTPIIMALLSSKNFDTVSSDDDTDQEANIPFEIIAESNTIKISSDEFSFAELIDGQHRIEGIKKSKSFLDDNFKLELPVLFVVDADLWTRAYLFAKINGEQKQVPYSFVSDLFGLSSYRCIEEVSHKMIAALNTENFSKFKNKIKMLGLKTNDDQTLSQGIMAREFQKLISPKGKLRKYYEKEKDKSLNNLMINYFNAIANTWEEEWSDTDKFIIRKTVGFLGFIKFFQYAYDLAYSNRDFDEKFFTNIFTKIKETNELSVFTKDNYSSNGAGANKLFADLRKSLNNIIDTL